MKQVALLLALFAVGCDDDDIRPTPDLGVAPELFLGGSIQLAQCGYEVTTREGASPPVVGAPVLGADPTPYQIHLGLAADPTGNMVVDWRTKDDATLASTVQFGEGDKTDRTIEGLTFQYEVPNADPVRVHEAHLCGLKPDTTYSYRVGGKDAAGREAWSDVHSFRTAPDRARADAEVTIVFIGDTRNQPDVWGRELKAADQMGRPDLILFSGDAVYFGLLQDDWDAWFDAAKDVLTRVPMVFAHGNHENNVVNYFAQFALPGNEEYYALDYGPMHLTVLNDSPAPGIGPDVAKQAQFLDDDLTAARTRPWLFVMHHKPIYTASTGHGGDPELLATWAPIYDKHHVDLVLNGHEHCYERTKPMKANAPQQSPADGTVYLVSGGGGAPLYEVGLGEWTEKIASTYNFAVLKVRAGKVTMTAMLDDGKTVLDTMTLTK